MGTYAIPLKRAIELAPGGDIGLNSYPIDPETRRAGLNEKIIRRYWNREIGLETVELFRFNMNRKMHEIMPFYNQLFATEGLLDDELYTMDIKTESTGESKTNSESTTTGDSATSTKSGGRSVASDTPQVMLSGEGDYASSASDTNNTSTGTGTTSEDALAETNQEDKSNSRTYGYQGSQTALVMERRAAIMNIELQIVEDLSELFMGIWDSSDDYFEQPYQFRTLLNP